MKVEDTIFAVFHKKTQLGTCFVVEVNGIEVIVTCKHIFEGIDGFKDEEFIIRDNRQEFKARIIEITEIDLVLLLPDPPSKCSKLFLMPEDLAVELPKNLSIFGYRIRKNENTELDSGTFIKGLEFEAKINNQYRVTIPSEDRGRISGGMSGSPLLWGTRESTLTALGMLIRSENRHGEALFIPGPIIHYYINNSEKISSRRPLMNRGTIPDVEGIWEFRLNDSNALFNGGQVGIYSIGYFHLQQNNDELHGAAINLLFYDIINENLIATFVYEIVHAYISEKQYGSISLKASCYLSNKSYSGGKAQQVVDYIENNFPQNVTLDIIATINLETGLGVGGWKVPNKSRKGEILISAHRYKFILPTVSTDTLKNQVFAVELNRNLTRDYLDRSKNTKYHVIQDRKGLVVAQCRVTPFEELGDEIKNNYEVNVPHECIYLSKFCVAKCARNRRLERVLAANMVKAIYKETEFQLLTLNCCKHHTRFYERLGFEQCGEGYFCSEVKDTVYPYSCKVSDLIAGSTFQRLIK